MATFVLLDPYPTTSVGPVSADLDDYVRNPGDFKKGNYFRFLKTSSNLTAALG